MTQAEIGQELINFFMTLTTPVRNLRDYQANPSAYIASKVTQGVLHQESANLLIAGAQPGGQTAVNAAVAAAQPGYALNTIVFPPI